MFFNRFPKTKLRNFKTPSQVSSIPICQPLSEDFDDLAVNELSVQLALALGGSPVPVKLEAEGDKGSGDGETQVEDTLPEDQHCEGEGDGVKSHRKPRKKILPGAKKTLTRRDPRMQ